MRAWRPGNGQTVMVEMSTKEAQYLSTILRNEIDWTTGSRWSILTNDEIPWTDSDLTRGRVAENLVKTLDTARFF